MLELKNVSKFYYSKGMVASGFTKISLKFDLGEFVAITGESGSGKSTLLNVISGLDSYEEGEMYIFGKETSHYTEKDYEQYRRKYIGNIFQNFNLVNSYTVYQNVELVLLLNGYKKREVKNKIIDIIKKVDLYKYRNKKVSKLSGGQKQRVAIARALATDAPIILADEPTGNLDKKSAESVLEVLHEVSKNKLVIVVTHNYDQIEKYVTRKITMHDGRVLEDKEIKKYDEVSEIKEAKYTNIKFCSKLKLGFRNAFNIIPKFLLITAVYLFVVLALFLAYSSFSASEYENGLDGYNEFFDDNNDKRIVVKKYDKSAFTDEEYESILKLPNVKSVVQNDLTIDEYITINDKDYKYYLSGKAYNISEIDHVDYGRMPEADDEIVLCINEYMYGFYGFDGNYDSIMKEKMEIIDLEEYALEKLYKVNIVGVIETEDYNTIFYVPNKIQDDISKYINKNNTTVKYKFYDINQTSYLNTTYGEILPSSKVAHGKIVIPEYWTYKCKNMKCNGKTVTVSIGSIYYEFTEEFKVSNYYNKKSFNKLTGYKYDKLNGAIFINDEDYDKMFDRGTYQSSVFIEDEKQVRQTISDLEAMGIKTMYLPDVTFPYSQEYTRIIKIIRVIMISGLIVALFFISYFIIRLILKSRNVYYSTLRILGAEAKTTKHLLVIELLVVSHISYLLFICGVIAVKKSIIHSEELSNLISYVSVSKYIILYIILMIMTLLISSRYARKLFKGSAMNAYKEEV